MLSTNAYGTQYNRVFDATDRVLKMLCERPSHAVKIANDAGGQQAVQAMFDAVLDLGHRMVLVHALNSPALPQWARSRLEMLLYGNSRPRAALLVRPPH